MNLKELQKTALKAAQKAGDYDGACIEGSLGQLGYLAAAALDVYKQQLPIDKVYRNKAQALDGVPWQFAKMLLEMAAFCEYFDIDLEEVVQMRLNQLRFEEKKQ